MIWWLWLLVIVCAWAGLDALFVLYVVWADYYARRRHEHHSH